MMPTSRPAIPRALHSALAILFLALVPALSLAPLSAAAQQLTVPHLDWRTVETRHFVIHYPSTASAWTLDMASRIESVYDAVSLLVGSAPSEKVTVMVQDPNNTSNGFALPLLGEPVIFFWPTPPDPGTGISDNHGWGEILSVHEYAHIAHLTRPTRNPKWRWLSRFLPARLGPLALASPRWVVEGYATYVEGKLTGMGRPHAAWRAAVLRQWALEGKLPTYAQLDQSGRFYGGAMAYLVGSAYLEWLVERKGEGDSSLVHVWRRMSARRTRSFSDAFAGVFGGLPEDLYGRFTAEITGHALEVERHLHASLGPEAPDSGAGRTVQALTWYTGAPAVSRDGSLLALVLTARDAPSRVMVWKTTEPPEDTSVIHAREREMKLDPEDVPAIQWRPRPRKKVATLYPQGGMSFSEPRFLPDGDHVLLTRSTGRGDGASRPDLFIWNFRTGSIRRVTHGAAIRHADPSPDGTFAVGSRCVEGICDVVRIDLATGRVATLVAGAPRVVFDRPRFSPDGSTIAVSVQADGRWRVALIDARASGPTTAALIGPEDDANRYDPAFLPGGKSLVLTSEAGGIQNVEILDLTTNAVHPLTAVTSAALAPEPSPTSDSVYFLLLHAKGFDLNVVPSDVIRPAMLRTTSALAPVTQIPPVLSDTFVARPVAPSRSYGIGPRALRLLPSVSYAAEGKSFGLMLAGTDPVGKLTWVAQGAYGDRGTWRGGALGATWRGTLPAIGATIFYTEDHPSEQHGGIAAPSALDVDYLGAVARMQLDRNYLTNAHRLLLGASLGRIAAPLANHESRALGYAEYAGAVQQTPGEWILQERVALSGSGGRTAGSSWGRGMVSAGVLVQRRHLGIAGEASYGVVNRDAAPFEQFVVGGTAPMLFESPLLAQRVAMPALPVGVAMGRQFASYRVSLPGSGLQPYFWGASAGNTLSRWHQVVGLEWDVRVSGLWVVRLPDVRLLLGTGYSLSEPVRHKTHAYLTLTYRP